MEPPLHQAIAKLIMSTTAWIKLWHAYYEYTEKLDNDYSELLATMELPSNQGQFNEQEFTDYVIKLRTRFKERQEALKDTLLTAFKDVR